MRRLVLAAVLLCAVIFCLEQSSLAVNLHVGLNR